MRHLTLAAALVAAALPACAQSNSAGWSAGDASDSVPIVSLPPQPSWPVLAPYPRTTASPPYIVPQPAPDAAEQQIRQLEQHNRLLMLQFQQRIYEDALRLPRR